MKKTLALLTIAVALASCTKETAKTVGPDVFDWKQASHQEIFDHYNQTYTFTDVIVAEPMVDVVIHEIMATDIWPLHVIERTFNTPLTVDEKLNILLPYLPNRNTSEVEMETIARKQSGSSSINGGGAYWDCSPALLAQTIAQLGTTVDGAAINNYYNAGTSSTKITLSDVLRAANGVNNTSFNDLVEIVDIVYEFEVSGDGNWLIGAVIVYDGVEYLYSNFEGTLGPLIFDPQDGGTYIVGPMPGGIVSIDVTGVYEAPVVE